jgi:hypothetical protein
VHVLPGAIVAFSVCRHHTSVVAAPVRAGCQDHVHEGVHVRRVLKASKLHNADNTESGVRDKLPSGHLCSPLDAYVALSSREVFAIARIVNAG